MRKIGFGLFTIPKFDYSKREQLKVWFWTIIKRHFQGFRFHLQLCFSRPATRPAYSRTRPVWRDPCALAHDSRGPRAESACVCFCVVYLCKASLTVPNAPKPQLSCVGLMNLVRKCNSTFLGFQPQTLVTGIQPKLFVWFAKGIHYLSIMESSPLSYYWSHLSDLRSTSNTQSNCKKHQG